MLKYQYLHGSLHISMVTDFGESITVIYVDDMLAAASNTSEMNCLMSNLHQVFDIMDLGDICWLLGISIKHDQVASWYPQPNLLHRDDHMLLQSGKLACHLDTDGTQATYLT